MTETDTRQRIEKVVTSHQVVLFMKGTRDEPQCGFSAQVVQILQEQGVDYHTVDVLDDWDIREGVKDYANWPTIPQLYVHGDFIGGCDIVMQLQREGKLREILQKSE